ncbi:MAG: hypothetical protein M3Z26_13035 [Bacteroidota bacterium]|nr:hypothetical protein [Bacteroidota bacterium]
MKKVFPVSLIIMIAFTSCTTYRYIYSASPANDPYFNKKGESKLTGYYSSSGDNNLLGEFAGGFDMHGAYAIENHWALTVGYFNRREKDVFNYYHSDSPFDSSIVKYKRNLFDIGAGYFVALNQNKTITFNLYGGFSSGKFSLEDDGVDHNDSNYNRYHDSKINKWFLQPSFNFMPGHHVRFSFGLKVSFVHYGNIHTSYTAEELHYFALDRIPNKTIPYAESFFNLQFGFPKYPWVKLDMELSGASQPLYNNPNNLNDNSERLRTRGSNASIGLNFDFSKIRKKK